MKCIYKVGVIPLRDTADCRNSILDAICHLDAVFRIRACCKRYRLSYIIETIYSIVSISIYSIYNHADGNCCYYTTSCAVLPILQLSGYTISIPLSAL